MLDDPKELLAKIRLGEDGALELKEVRIEGDRVVAPHRSSFDETPVATAQASDLDPDLWRRYGTPRSRDTDEAFLIKIGMAASSDGDGLKPTVAGILMGSHEPHRWLPNAFIQAVAYRGTEIVPLGSRELYQLDARDITGSLDEQALEACRFVSRNMRIGATKSLGRRDIPQFDLSAIFEAVVNAVVHRDYSVYGSKIRLRMFADRLELFSPGAIANTLTLESLPYRQAARNETLASLLARTPVPAETDWLKTDRETFMDRRGEGVQIILERSQALSGRLPEYRLFDEAELCLTLYAPPEVGLPEGA